MNAPLYTTEILRLATSLNEPRALDREDGRAELRSTTCGSRVVTAVQLDGEGRVEALSQQVHACAFGQASAALLERSAVGRGRADLQLALDEFASWLDGCEAALAWPGLGALAPARSRRSRHGAILLPFRALLAAIEAVDA
ncbi:MAG TPA: iron-sulfur cluster assembly scaffold protein [Sphingomicrobium sp.]|nr:iron-sulfur cluster assembly scaffold protein [Sphingomicrobium sp.]